MKRIYRFILKQPARLLLIASAATAWYVTVSGIADISFATPIILTVIVGSYFAALWLDRRAAPKPEAATSGLKFAHAEKFE